MPRAKPPPGPLARLVGIASCPHCEAVVRAIVPVPGPGCEPVLRDLGPMSIAEIEAEAGAAWWWLRQGFAGGIGDRHERTCPAREGWDLGSEARAS